MKYFTKELWRGDNQRLPASDAATQQGQSNEQEYIAQLEHLSSRLSKQGFRFFREESLHDGRLLAFVAGDKPDYDDSKMRRFDINSHRTSVYMKLLGANLDFLYTLKYTKVRKILFDFPSDDPLFYQEGDHIGDWGYDELTAVDDSYLRHEVLFASGTIILIEFKNFTYAKERCEGSRYQGQK